MYSPRLILDVDLKRKVSSLRFIETESGVIPYPDTEPYATGFLDVDPPNLTEVREILADIIEDDRRAGEVIRRLRAMA